jgi:hypothetical protein
MKHPFSRIRIILFSLSVFVLASWLAGVILAPRFEKQALVHVLENKLHRTVTLQALHINLLRLSARLDGLRVQEAHNKTTLLSIDQIYLRFSIASLRHGTPVISTLDITAPNLHVIRDGDEHFNLSDIVTDLMRPTPHPAHFILEDVHLTQGGITLDDNITHSQQHIKGLTVVLPWLSKRERDKQLPIQAAVSFLLNGAPIRISTNVHPFTANPNGNAHITVRKLPLQPLLAYLPASLPFHLNAGQLTSQLDLQFNLPAKKPPLIILTGKLDVRQLAVLSKQSSTPVFELANMQTDILQANILQQHWQIRSLLLDAPHVALQRNAQGRWEVQDLIPARKNRQPSTQSAQIAIGQINVIHGRLDMESNELPASSAIHLDNITFNLQHFSNAPGKQNNISLSLSTNNGAQIASRGRFRLSPLLADGNFSIRNFTLVPYTPWLAQPLLSAPLPVKLESGTLHISGHYRYEHALKLDQIISNIHDWKMSLPNHPQAQFTLADLTLDGGMLNLSTHKASMSHLDLRKINLQLPHHRQPALNIAQFVGTHAAIDFSQHQFSLTDIHSQNGTLRLQQDRKGQLALLALLSTGKTSGAATGRQKTKSQKHGTHGDRRPIKAKPSSGTVPWSWHVDNLAFQHYTAILHDHTSNGGKHLLTIHDIQLTVQHLSSDKQQAATIGLQASLHPGGKLDIQGTLQPKPFHLTSQISINNLPLVPLQDFFAPYLRFTITNGDVSTQGSLVITNLSPFRMNFAGAAHIDYFGAMTQNTAQNFLDWQSLALRQIHAVSDKNNLVSVGTIALDKSFMRFIINPDGSFNLQNLFKLPKSKTQGGKIRVQIGRILLQNSHVKFYDNHIQPNYSANITQLSGTVSKLDSDQHHRATLQLNGQINGQGQVNIDGQIDPFHNNPYLNILARLKDFELTPLSPYAGMYAGYDIRKGMLSFDAHYHVEDHQLTADNRFYLNQLSFGHRINSPKATQLPIRLAIALLKDRHGNINVDLPISGSLNDPQFSMGNIIYRAITNLIIKTTSAPFTLLANLFNDTDAQKLRHIDFASGSAALSPESLSRLQKIAHVLTERPELILDISGIADSARDVDGLKQLTLQRMVRDEKRRQIIASGQPVQRITVSASEYPKYLTAAYRRDPIPDKPRNLLHLYKTLPVADMESRMRAYININSNALNNLANQRALAVETNLQQTQHIQASRLYLLSPVVTTSATTPQNQVEFTLDAN